MAASLTALREMTGLSQRQLAERIEVRQPRIAAIERSRNVTVDVLERFVAALGGQIEVSVVHGGKRIALLGGNSSLAAAEKAPAKRAARSAAAAKATSAKRLPAKVAHTRRTATMKAVSAKRAAGKKSA